MKTTAISSDSIKRLTKARKLGDLSSRQLSTLAGLASNYSAMIERRAAKNPAFGAVLALARVLGISLDWLAYGVGEAPSREHVQAAVAQARASEPSKAAA